MVRQIVSADNFIHGQVDNIEAESIPRGAASRSLNWLTMGDKIELRRGTYLIGAEIAGSGKVTGIGRGRDNAGADIMFYTYARKILYYDTTTEDFIEIGTNTLPAAASGEEVAFSPYHSLAGDQLFASGPNSSIYKIMVANPGSITDLLTTSYKGLIRIKQNRMFLWNRKDSNSDLDKTGFYQSWIDNQNYTSETSESIGTGDGAEKTFSGTLAFKAGGAKRTCFGVSITDGTETFTDNFRGTLTGDAGGTGTINYTSGAYSVTFNTAPTNLQAITGDYQWEDSTDEGIADFSYSATRVAGEGNVLRQDDGGGPLQNVLSIKEKEYCLHEHKTWAVEFTADDTNVTNTIFRGKVGIPNWRAACETGRGIFYIDDIDEENPKFRLMTFAKGSEEIIPVSISNNIDLSDYRFDLGATFEWGDYILFACRTSNRSYNNRVLAYHKIWKSIDVLEAFVSCFEIYEGSLWTGCSLANNVYQLFSGFDDDDSKINNYWNGNLDKCDLPDNLKKTKKFIVEGEIGKEQQLKVFLSLDGGAFVEIGQDSDGNPAIQGDGAYVDRGQAIDVGRVTLGRSEVGGGSGGVEAYHYKKEISLQLDKFEKAMVRFEAVELGYVSVSSYKFWDVRKKQQKLPAKYRKTYE